MPSFLTPILARHQAEIEQAIADAQSKINALLSGATANAKAPAVKRQGRAERQASQPRKKRSPEALERLVDDLLDYISGHPGQRIEQIASAMGYSTKELNLPIKKLIARKAITTKGQKRAMSYAARGGK